MIVFLHRYRWLIAAVVTIVVGASWYHRWSFERVKARALAVADSATRFADSVRIVNAAQAGRIAALRQSAELANAQATSWRTRAQAVEGALGQLAVARDKLRDSLRLITTGADSLPVLVRLVANLTDENTTLRASGDDALRADSLRRMAVDSLRAGADSAASRYALLETSHRIQENALRVSQEALARADPPCRIALWHCPSRTVVAVGTAVVTVVVVRAVTP